jgi:hypothetical protein
MTAPETDRNRWLALYVLCLGMLMIVLRISLPRRRRRAGTDGGARPLHARAGSSEAS